MASTGGRAGAPSGDGAVREDRWRPRAEQAATSDAPAEGSEDDVCGSSSLFFFFSSRRRHTRLQGDWSSDVCSSDLLDVGLIAPFIFNDRDGRINKIIAPMYVHNEFLGSRETLNFFKYPQRGVELKIGRASCRERV